jgi:fructose-specific phosphotransferase system IIA component
MIQFGTILKEACVAVGVEARDKGDALEAVTDLLVAGGGGSDAPRLLSEILAREALATTGIGEGVAVPHALSEHIHDTSMAVARLSKPIDFDAVDGEPVDLLFLLIGPKGTSVHLQLLSKLARLLHDPEFRQAARAVPDAKSLARLLYSRD